MYKGHKIIALCISRASDERNLDFIRALNTACNKNNYSLIILHSCTDFYRKTRSEEGDKAVFDLLDFDIVDAVVLFEETILDKTVVERIVNLAKKNNLPLISIGVEREDAVNFVFDYESGFEQVVRHAIEHHNIKKPCFIAGQKGHIFSERRIDVYKKVLAENNIAFDESRLFYGDYWWMPTKNAIDEIIASGDIPDGIICANDNMAIAACEHLRKLGYRVPEDIMVTGFDGIREAKCCNPPITTAKCDMATATDELVKVAEEMINGRETRKCYYIPHTIDVYHSCGCDVLSQIDIGELYKNSENRFYRYQSDERALYEMVEEVIKCETPNHIIKNINDSDFYNTIIIVNNDCFDESINPADYKRNTSYDDDMTLLYLAHTDMSLYPQPFKCKDVVPNLDYFITESGRPLLFNSISFFGVAFGYVCFWFEAYIEHYSKINQFITSLNNVIGSYRTVKYLKYTAESIENMSTHDFMTGLLNRKGFYKSLDSIVKKSEQEGKHILVSSVDLNGLKYINDNFGHDEGDFAIKSVADAVSGVSCADKICGRFGGDEIVVCAVCNDKSDEEKFKAEVCEKLKALNESISKPYSITASVGVFVTETVDFDFESSLKEADNRMYIMKIGHPNRRKR